MKTTTPHARFGALLVMAVAVVAPGCGDSGPEAEVVINPIRLPDPMPRTEAAALGVPDFVGGPVVAKPIPPLVIPTHPFLDQRGDGRIHNDHFNSGVYDRDSLLGNSPEVTSIQLNEGDALSFICAMSAFREDGRVISSCIEANITVGASTNLIMFDPETMEILAEKRIADRPLVANASGGGYFSYDRDGRVLIGPATNIVEVWDVEVTNGDAEFVLQESYDVSMLLDSETTLQDSIPDWEGRIWYIAINGQVGYTDAATGQGDQIDLGEGLQNSMAVDETGVYVLTFEALYKFNVNDDGNINELWRRAYDPGTENRGLAPGSGSSPTLLGTKGDLISICDNADSQVNLMVYDRTTGAIVCQEPMFRPEESGCENTVMGYNDDISIPNNGGFTRPLSPANTIRPGVERWHVREDRSGCDLVWKNDTAYANAVNLSTKTGLLYGYGVDYNENEFDAFYLTANDWETGEEVWRFYAGDGRQYDTITGQPHLHPNGSIFVGALGGIMRFRDAPAAE